MIWTNSLTLHPEGVDEEKREKRQETQTNIKATWLKEVLFVKVRRP